MKAIYLFGFPVALTLAAGCTQSQVATSLNDLKTACAAYDVATQNVKVLTGGAAATAAKVQAPFSAFCSIVDSGLVPGNADANSLAWVATGTQTVNTIAALAK